MTTRSGRFSNCFQPVQITITATVVGLCSLAVKTSHVQTEPSMIGPIQCRIDYHYSEGTRVRLR